MKYRKKPVVIEAVRWTGSNREEIQDFCGNDAYFLPTGWDSDGYVTEWTLIVHTHGGIRFTSEGDYIIRCINGEHYPCEPDVFAKTYEEVEE